MKKIIILVICCLSLSMPVLAESSFNGKTKPKIISSYVKARNTKYPAPRATRTYSKPKPKSMLSKMKDAAARGFGWEMGKQAARETFRAVKRAVNGQ
ncbi:MAG: hypothetical protein NT007_01650 [Candidatus Kapabacteria bacterium]|nr:hypothetical protein [Candidatus Kapabacteria bacterium]